MHRKTSRSGVPVETPARPPRRRLFLRVLPVALAAVLLLAAAPQGKDELDRQLIDKAIDAVKEIRLRMGDATPRQIALGIFAFGPKFKLYPDDGDAYVLALEYLLTDECWRKERIFHEDDGKVRLRRFKEKRKIVTEQLPNEMMMYLALAGVSLDAKVTTDNDEEVTWKDVVETAKGDVDPRRELSCTLTAFDTYLDWGEAWEVGKKKRKVTQRKLLAAALERNPAEYAEEGAWHLFALATIRRSRAGAGGLPEKMDKIITDRLTQRRVRLKAQQSSVGSLGFLGVKGLDTTSRDLNWLLISGEWEEVRQPWLDRAAVWLAKELARATKRKNVTYDTLALGARALQQYRRLRFPGSGDGGGAGPGKIAE